MVTAVKASRMSTFYDSIAHIHIYRGLEHSVIEGWDSIYRCTRHCNNNNHHHECRYESKNRLKCCSCRSCVLVDGKMEFSLSIE